MPSNPARFSPADRGRLGAPGVRTFLAIADLWKLTEEERRLVLGLPARSTYHHWAETARERGGLNLDVDVLLRLSAVLGIREALQVLHDDGREGAAWLRRPHGATAFCGKPPMASGIQDELLTVRRFLDGARSSLYMEPNRADRDFIPYTDAGVVVS